MNQIIRIILPLLLLTAPISSGAVTPTEEFPVNPEGLRRISDAYEAGRRPAGFQSRQLKHGGTPAYILELLQSKSAALTEDQNIALIYTLGKLTRVALWQYAERQVQRNPDEILPAPGTPESDLRILIMLVPYGYPLALRILGMLAAQTAPSATATAAGAELDLLAQTLADIALERGPLAHQTGWNLQNILNAIAWLELMGRPSSKAALLRISIEPAGRSTPARVLAAKVHAGVALTRMTILQESATSIAPTCDGLLFEPVGS